MSILSSQIKAKPLPHISLDTSTSITLSNYGMLSWTLTFIYLLPLLNQYLAIIFEIILLKHFNTEDTCSNLLFIHAVITTSPLLTFRIFISFFNNIPHTTVTVLGVSLTVDLILAIETVVFFLVFFLVLFCCEVNILRL